MGDDNVLNSNLTGNKTKLNLIEGNHKSTRPVMFYSDDLPTQRTLSGAPYSDRDNNSLQELDRSCLTTFSNTDTGDNHTINEASAVLDRIFTRFRDPQTELLSERALGTALDAIGSGKTLFPAVTKAAVFRELASTGSGGGVRRGEFQRLFDVMSGAV